MAPATWVHFCIVFLVATYSYQPTLAWRPAESENIFGICWKFRVHVANGLSSNERPLFIHCQSKDDDLGDHNLRVGEDFEFHFRLKLIGKTFFTCDMIWGYKHQRVEVFKEHVESIICCTGDQNCFWLARDDGIYFSTDNQNWIRRLDWLTD